MVDAPRRRPVHRSGRMTRCLSGARAASRSRLWWAQQCSEPRLGGGPWRRPLATPLGQSTTWVRPLLPAVACRCRGRRLHQPEAGGPHRLGLRHARHGSFSLDRPARRRRRALDSDRPSLGGVHLRARIGGGRGGAAPTPSRAGITATKRLTCAVVQSQPQSDLGAAAVVRPPLGYAAGGWTDRRTPHRRRRK